jgi:hypothetical protein
MLVGPYNATAKLYVNCSDTRGAPVIKQKTYSVRVYDHVPIDSLTAATEIVKPGSRISLVVHLQKPAPPSGTRVFLSTNDHHEVLAPGTLPRFVTVPAASNELEFQVPTIRNSPTGVLVIGATVAGVLKFVRVEIQ